ncbi:uncharacterized protein LOC131157354 [Malania oleifera]|uniref:uncharacterized protein LOC131157354 n=1 Tax=Malania oleifera TaxID=397392 RepID=UPI0025ADADE7|nr:uncharacterized protein LOC131157354 [Malania oleifera]
MLYLITCSLILSLSLSLSLTRACAIPEPPPLLPPPAACGCQGQCCSVCAIVPTRDSWKLRRQHTALPTPSPCTGYPTPSSTAPHVPSPPTTSSATDGFRSVYNDIHPSFHHIAVKIWKDNRLDGAHSSHSRRGMKGDPARRTDKARK